MNGFHYYYSKSSLSYDANKGVSWIDYDKLGNPIRVQFTDHSITKHVYAADGRNKEPHPNPLPRRGNSIISSHLPLGEIREGYSTILQNTNYYPYGGMTSISTGQGVQQISRSAADELYNLTHSNMHVDIINLEPFVEKMLSAVTKGRFLPRQHTAGDMPIVHCSTIRNVLQQLGSL